MSAQASPLKKSADFVRAGKLDKARELLVELLRTEPNNAQAWYLLSYTLDDPQRKQYALMQALKADPGFERAENRLRQLRGQPPLEPKPVAAKPATKPLARPVEPSSPAFQPEKSPPPAAEPDPFRAAFAQEEPEQPSLEESLRAEHAAQPPSAGRPGLRRLLIGLVLLAAFVALFWFSRDFFAGLLAGSNAPQATATEQAIGFSTFPPTFTAGSPGELQATATEAAPPQVASLNELTEGDLAQIALIREQTSLVRGLNLLDPVEPVLVPAEQVGVLLSGLTAEQEDVERTRQERILRAFGLLGPLEHLDDYEFNLHADPYGGVFSADPDLAYLFGTEFSDVLSFVYARANGLGLANGSHAEQVQAVSNCSLFSDECRAQRAFIRGDGYLTGDQWLNSYAGAAIFQAVNQAEPNYVWAQTEEPSTFAQQDLAFYAETGLEFVRTLFEGRGWAQVDALYAQLPTTSEQILHPEKFAAGETAVEVPGPDMAAALGSQWQPQGGGQLGEWLTQLVLSSGQNPAARIAPARAATAAAGWGGDAFQAFWRPSDGQMVLAQHWVMDDEDEAGELVVALQDYLTLRMGSGASQVGLGDCWQAVDQQACVYWNGSEVLWLLLPNQQTILDAALNAFPEFQG